MTIDESDQRHEDRYRCRCYATLLSSNQTWEAHLLNLSEHGALLGIIVPHKITADDAIDLLIELEDAVVNLRGSVAHVKEHYVGIECEPQTQNDFAQLMSKLEQLGRESNKS